MSETQITFDHVHPSYSRMFRRWTMARDFWLGGLNVIAPETFTERVGTQRAKASNTAATTGTTSTSPSSTGSAQDTYWSSATSRSYLWKNQRETPGSFDARKQKAVHIPIFRPIINIFSAGVLRVEPSRDGMDDWWRAWMADVDQAGTDYDAFVREALRWSMGYGRYHAMADRPAFEEQAESRLHQQARGERTYLVGVSPLAVEDWETDAFGGLIWVRIAEPDIRPRNPTDVRDGAYPTQYRILYRDGWEVWQKSDKTWLNTGGNPRKSGRVPLATLWSAREADWACESPICDALDIDREVFNLYSQLGVLEDIQSFALLYLPVEEGSAMGAIDIGPESAFQGPPGGSPAYVSPGSDLVNAKWERIEKRIHMARQQMGVGRGRAEYSKEERSADAIMRESEDKLTFLSLLSKSTNEFDQQCLRLVAEMEDIPEDKIPTVNYPRGFDTKGTQAQINELLQLASTKTVPMSAMITLSKPIVAAMLKEKGVDERIVTATLAGMDAEIQKAIAGSKGESGDKSSQKAAARENAQTELLGTVGGVNGIVNISGAVSRGEMAEESAAALLENIFGFDSATAKKLAGSKSELAPTEGM